MVSHLKHVLPSPCSVAEGTGERVLALHAEMCEKSKVTNSRRT